MEKIVLRPSSLATFVGCSRQWYQVFIKGHRSIPNARAAMGTGVHAGIEQMWNEAIKTKKKDPNLSMMNDAAVESYDKEVKLSEGSMQYDTDLDDNTVRANLVKGNKAFVEDVVPMTDIPKAVETRVTKEINHKIVKSISGTIDYLGDNVIADVKTSKRKIVPASHTLQQSMYRYLANESGENIEYNLIQGVVFNKTKTVGTTDALDCNVPQAKYITNNLLDRLDLAITDKIDPDIIFPGNPKHYLCSDKYCSLRSTCPFVNGDK